MKREGVVQKVNQYGDAGEQVVEISFITEGDVYRLIVHSKLPSAERFEHWVFDEALPSIRKHGVYMSDSILDQVIQHPEVIYTLAKKLEAEREQLEGMLSKRSIRVFNRPVGSGMVALQFLCAVMCLRCVCSLLLFRLFPCFMLRQSRFCFRGSGRIQQSQKRFEAGGVYKFLRHRIRYKPDGNTSGVLLRNRTFAKLAVPDTLSDEAHSQNLHSLMFRLFI